jgi:hypothetical protein
MLLQASTEDILGLAGATRTRSGVATTGSHINMIVASRLYQLDQGTFTFNFKKVESS